MKHQIRKGVFETNSSSVHAIAIGREGWGELPEELKFTVGQFGWEQDTYTDMSDRARYLFTAICYLYYDGWEPDDEEKLNGIEENPEYTDWKDYISDTLDSYGVRARFYTPDKEDFYYIDHASSLTDWLKRIRGSEELLMMYLFSPTSIIKTGNDNDDTVPCMSDFSEDDYMDIEEKYN